MKKNDLVKVKNNYYRIISFNGNKMLVIDCVKRTMPFWVDTIEIEVISEKQLSTITNITLEDIETLSPTRRNTAYKRFGLIAGLVSVIEDKRLYSIMLNEIACQNNISKDTLRNYLCDYLVFQNVSVLAPKERKTEEALTQDQKNYRWALNKYFYNQNKNSLKFAYNSMLREKYCDNKGQLLKEYPSFFQFRYFYQKTRNTQNYLITRNGMGDYQRNDRPLLGDNSQSFAPNLGVAMLDGTICDIHLVDNSGKLIGRPNLVACIDTHSSICMGYHLSLEAGVYSLRNLMVNVVEDKQEYCEKFGIKINKGNWNCNQLPGTCIVDRGSDFISKNFSQLTDLGITLIDLPPFRPDLKAIVEKFFDCVQGYFKGELKNKGVVDKDFDERTRRIDYRKQACLTLEQFEKILIHCILYYNSQRLLENYPFTQEMIETGIRPTASEIWNYKLNEIGTNLIAASIDMVALTLLPRTTGKFTRQGLKVLKLRYHCEGFTERYLNGEECVIAYSPEEVSRVWLFEEGIFTEFKLIETRYAGKDLESVQEIQEQQKLLIKNNEGARTQAQIDLSNSIREIVKFSNPINNVEISKMATHRKKQKIKSHKTIGGEIK